MTDLLILTKKEKINAQMLQCREESVLNPKPFEYIKEKGNYDDLISTMSDYYILKSRKLFQQYTQMEMVPKSTLHGIVDRLNGMCYIVQSLLQREKDQAQETYHNFRKLVESLKDASNEIKTMSQIFSIVIQKPYNFLITPDLENDCVCNYMLKNKSPNEAKSQLEFKTVIEASVIEELKSGIVAIKEDNIAKFKQYEVMQSSSAFLDRLQLYEERAKEKESDFRNAYEKVKTQLFEIGDKRFDGCTYNTNTLYADLVLNEGRMIKKLIESKEVEQSWISKLPKKSA